MQRYQGKAINKGIGIAKVLYYGKKNTVIVKREINDKDIDNEIDRFNEAKEKARGQLMDLASKVRVDLGEEDAVILDSHILILDDVEFSDAIIDRIRTKGVNAEYAISKVCEKRVKKLKQLGDKYFRARAVDVRDVASRLISILDNSEVDILSGDEPVIIVANDLTPSQTVSFDKNKVVALVTRKGTSISHTAILARSMGIPAISGIDVSIDMDSKLAVVDGFLGQLVLEPVEEVISAAREKVSQKLGDIDTIKLVRENIIKAGADIKVCANIGNAWEVDEKLVDSIDAIGLLRSEFLYLGRSDYPSEDELFDIYKKIVLDMKGKRVVIRTIDIGSDKKADYWKMADEENPALGLRGIRLCLSRPEIFETQLRAILRAAYYGDVAIMYPMISSEDEVHCVKEMVSRIARELDSENVEYKIPRQGIMIETPAAALISDDLARLVDFFSIGTNDLAQYTIAADRQNDMMENHFTSRHKAVTRLINMTVQNAHAAGIPVSICGELAADMSLTQTFLDMGIDALSVAP